MIITTDVNKCVETKNLILKKKVYMINLVKSKNIKKLIYIDQVINTEDDLKNDD